MTDSWPFDDAPNTACFTTRFVLDDGEPILMVTHDEDDGAWQFLCGSTDNPDDGRVIGLDCVLRIDPGLAELADLPLGWKAWRDSPEEEWDRYAADEEVGLGRRWICITFLVRLVTVQEDSVRSRDL